MMENKAHALMAGIFTLVLLTAVVLIGLWLNRDREVRVPYEMATKLSVPGLNPQAAVRYRGLDVGKVDEIAFDPQVPGQILVRISIKPDTPITFSTYGMLGYQGVTGIAYIQLDDDGIGQERVTSSKNRIARIEMRPSLLDSLQSKGLVILQQTEELTTRFNALLEAANQKTMLTAFSDVSHAANKIEAIPKQLQPTLTQLPASAQQAQQSLASLNSLSKDVSTLSANLNALTTSLQAPQGPLAQIGAVASSVDSDALPRINLLANETRSTVRTLNRTMDSFNQRPQSILFGNSAPQPGPGETGFSAPPSR